MPHHHFAILLASLAIQACDRRTGSAAAQSTPCVVERIADGDTFTCRDGRRVRLIGIDAPELAQGEVRTSGARRAASACPAWSIRAPRARCRPSRPVRPRAGSRLERPPAGERGAGPRRMGDALHRASERQVCRATGAGAKAGPSGRRGPVGKRRVRVCAVGVSTRGVPLTQGTRGAPARRTSSRSVMLSMVSNPTSRPVESTTGRAGNPLARRRSSAS